MDNQTKGTFKNNLSSSGIERMGKEKWFMTLVLTVLCCLGMAMPMKAQAAGLTVTKASAGGGSQAVTAVGDVYTLETGGRYTVSGTTTSEVIKVTGTNVEVTLNGVDINVFVEGEASGKAAFDLAAGASVKLILKGENSLKSGIKSAGVHVPATASVEISAGEANGKLIAIGGFQGAGIGGGSSSRNAGRILISGGIIEASGGHEGAGIGGGTFGEAGTIEITGGTVTSRSTISKETNTGAGIGGGLGSGGGTIIISGGTVHAIAEKGGAGIGTGAYGGTCGEVTINGGSIVAAGGFQGAGIGGGMSAKGGSVIINGGTIVSTGGDGAAGIGGGKNKSNEGRAGTLIIAGGSVKRTGYAEKEAKATADGTKEVHLVELQLNGISSSTAVTSGQINDVACANTPNPATGVYGLKDVSTDSAGKVYLWLQKQVNMPVDLTAGGKQYELGAFTQALTISTQSLDAGTVGTAYTAAISAGPGKPRYVLGEGSLPSGLTMDKMTGKITGIPKKEGEYSFVVKAYVGAMVQQKTFKIRVIAVKGTAFTDGDYTYQITDARTDGNGTVTLTGLAKGKKVTKVVTPKTVTYDGFSYKVTAVGAKAFYKNRTIKEVSIGQNVKTIGKRAFFECKNLTKVNLGNSVDMLESLAFYKCKKLKTVTIGTGLKTIGNHTFCHNTAMRTLTIKSKQLKKVGTHNLYKTNNMKIKVPSAKVKKYKRLFKGQGQKKKVKVVKR